MSLPDDFSGGQPSEFQTNLTILRQSPLFSGLPMEALKVIALLCIRERFKQGDYLFRQGEDDGRALYIVKGAGRLEHVVDQSVQIVRECQAGTFFGVLTLMGSTPRLFSLHALGDTTCLVLSRERFAKAAEKFPHMLPKLCQAVVKAIGHWEARLLTEYADQCNQCRNRLGISLL